MKTLMLFAVIITATGCFSSKELQVEMVNARLVRIDTIQRYQDNRQLLTWKDDRNTMFISYEPLESYFLLGTRMVMLRRK